LDVISKEINIMEYDIYGFPKNNVIETRLNTDLKKWFKIGVWLIIVSMILLKIGGMFLAGYLSFNEFIIEASMLKYIKIALSTIFSELYLGYKLLIIIKHYIFS
jgi:hypothetical protein